MDDDKKEMPKGNPNDYERGLKGDEDVVFPSESNQEGVKDKAKLDEEDERREERKEDDKEEDDDKNKDKEDDE